MKSSSSNISCYFTVAGMTVFS